MTLPVFCPNCGAVFASRAFHFEDATNVTLVGNKESCPNCGAMAEIPDGVFNFVGDTITVLSAPGRTHDQLRRFQEILREARDTRASPADVADAIRRDAPDLAPFVAGLLIPKTAGEFYALLTLILTVITLLLVRPEGSQLSPQETELLVHNAVTQAIKDSPTAPASPGGAVVSGLPSVRATPSSPRQGRKRRLPKTYGRSKSGKRKRGKR
jgi:hypothetical protein